MHATDEASIACKGNQSQKRRKKRQAESSAAVSALVDAESDASRAVEALRQFEEDNNIRRAKIETSESDEDENLKRLA